MTKRLPRRTGLLTTREAALTLGVAEETVTRWRTMGFLEEAEPPRGSRPRMFDEGAVGKLRDRPPARSSRLRGLDLTAVADAKFRSRFWSKVDVTGECWLWTRHITDAGYGQFTVSKGNFRLAHVVSYALIKGAVPAGAEVCHRCDNPPCVRPEHLFLGTHEENIRDMFEKGRQGSRHPGMERYNARLTDDDVRAIRASLPYFGRTAELARRYGVSSTTIRAVLNDRKWRHVA